MAAIAGAFAGVDLSKSRTFDVRLGESVREGDGNGWVALRYNYLPELGSRDAERTITANGKNGLRLKLADGDDEYTYRGLDVGGQDVYVLIVKGGGADKGAVLEKLSAIHIFNVSSTPDETDAATLKQRYPQLNAQTAQLPLLQDADDAEDVPPDPANPFDYRHLLKSVAESKAQRPEAEAPRGPAGTPPVQARAATSTTLSRPAKKPASVSLFQQKKRKATAAAKPDAKRVKATADSQPSTSTAPAASKLPQIRMDRKASIRKPSVDDSGELIIEDEDEQRSKPHSRSAMSLALNGQLGSNGPISLRSAASSPAASYVASPTTAQREEFELGEESPEKTGRNSEEADEEDDDDADVENLELPSPATVHKPSVSAATVTAGDEDDLDAQLAAALDEEDGGGMGQYVQEEEEESEEE